MLPHAIWSRPARGTSQEGPFFFFFFIFFFLGEALFRKRMAEDAALPDGRARVSAPRCTQPLPIADPRTASPRLRETLDQD